MNLYIADNLASYHSLCGYRPCSQGLFPNAEQLIGFLLQPIVLRQERSTGNKVEQVCIIAGFSNSTRTNSFDMVGSRESSRRVWKKNIQAKVKYKKIRISSQQKRCFILSESRSDIQQHRGQGRELITGSYSAHPAPHPHPHPKTSAAATFASQGDAHLRTKPKLNSCIIP